MNTPKLTDIQIQEYLDLLVSRADKVRRIYKDGYARGFKARPKSKVIDYSTHLLPEWLPQKVWVQWVKHRISIGKPIRTARIADRAIGKLKGLKGEGFDPQDVVDYSQDGGWWDLYKPKDKQHDIIIAREQKHEAEKKARAIPRRVKDSPALCALNKRFVALGGDLLRANTLEAKIRVRNQQNKLALEIQELKDEQSSVSNLVRKG